MKNDMGTVSSPYRKRLTPVVNYIEQHFSENISQQTLCKVINVSPQQLCRMFKECFETRPIEFLAQKRIKTACDMLCHTDKKIELIAYDTGFNNFNYFCREFKKIIKMTPSEYRNSFKEK